MRTTFYLIPHPDGRWIGKKDGTEQHLMMSDDKQEVLDYLINLCDAHLPCSIFIHNERGELIEERSFGTKHFPT